MHYFKTLEAMGGNSHDGAKIVAKMKETKTDDRCSVRVKFSPEADARSIRLISSK